MRANCEPSIKRTRSGSVRTLCSLSLSISPLSLSLPGDAASSEREEKTLLSDISMRCGLPFGLLAFIPSLVPPRCNPNPKWQFRVRAVSDERSRSGNALTARRQELILLLKASCSLFILLPIDVWLESWTAVVCTFTEKPFRFRKPDLASTVYFHFYCSPLLHRKGNVISFQT